MLACTASPCDRINFNSFSTPKCLHRAILHHFHPRSGKLICHREIHFLATRLCSLCALQPEKNNVPGGLRVPRRRRGRGKAPASFLNHHLDTRYYESQLQREAATPSEKAGRLWGRINAAYCVVPYMTSSQRYLKKISDSQYSTSHYRSFSVIL